MKSKKPDRFERIVGVGFRDRRYRPQDLILARDAVGLLRREHAWMRRMVKSIQKMHIEHMDEWIVLDSVLKQLDQRRK